MAEVVSLLKQLGFAEYEARAYLALVRQSPLNGYELARASTVPRADIYSVLQRLEQRGAVLRVETETGTRYAPVPADELLRGLEIRFQETLESSRRSLEHVAAPPANEYVGNARGYGVLLDHARGLIEESRQQLLVSLARDEAEALGAELERAEERGVEITTLCLNACASPCGHCQGHIHRYRLGPEPPARWLVVVRDQVEMLAGEIHDQDQDALSIRSRQPMVVGLATRQIQHGIALATVLSDLGDRLETLLSPEATSALESLGAGGEPGNWLDEMRSALSERKTDRREN